MSSQDTSVSFPPRASYGLEMQAPWSMHLLEGRKTIETRKYTLPEELLDRKIFILESLPGHDGVSSIDDKIDLTSDNGETCRIKGWCKFGSVKEYTAKDVFEKDEQYHLVSPNSGYSWKEGETIALYGWVVKDFELFKEGEEEKFTFATREMRSIFRLYTNANSP